LKINIVNENRHDTVVVSYHDHFK